MPTRCWRAELPDGSLELIDGHLRAETTPDVEVPVLVLDLDEARGGQAAGRCTTRLAGMAEANDEVLADLLGQVETENDAVQALLDGMLGEPDAPARRDRRRKRSKALPSPRRFRSSSSAATRPNSRPSSSG